MEDIEYLFEGYETFEKFLKGYTSFRQQYASGSQSIMRSLSHDGQKPKVMIIACSDSRVDPALILQCDPGDLFVVRNVANIVPPFEKDKGYHGTSAALEFGICFLGVQHLILLGHSQCGGIQTLLNDVPDHETDFIKNWVSIIKENSCCHSQHSILTDDYAKHALNRSYQNCLTFPWIQQKIENNNLRIHRWFFEVEHGMIFTYSPTSNSYIPLIPP